MIGIGVVGESKEPRELNKFVILAPVLEFLLPRKRREEFLPCLQHLTVWYHLKANITVGDQENGNYYPNLCCRLRLTPCARKLQVSLEFKRLQLCECRPNLGVLLCKYFIRLGNTNLSLSGIFKYMFWDIVYIRVNPSDLNFFPVQVRGFEL